MKFLKLMVVLMVLVILGKLFYIQIIQHDEWVAKAAAQQTLQNVLKAKRGEIYMLDGETPVPVVMNATVYTVIDAGGARGFGGKIDATNCRYEGGGME